MVVEISAIIGDKEALEIANRFRLARPEKMVVKEGKPYIAVLEIYRLGEKIPLNAMLVAFSGEITGGEFFTREEVREYCEVTIPRWQSE